MFEIMDHTGEAGFIIRAKTREEIIKDAIDALIFIYFGEDNYQERKGKEEIGNKGEKESIGKVEQQKKMKLKIRSDGIDFTDALITLLNEVVFLFDAKKIVPFKLEKVKIIENHGKVEIEAEILFDNLKEKNLIPKIYIKAVTYGGAELRKEGENFILPIIVDI